MANRPPISPAVAYVVNMMDSNPLLFPTRLPGESPEEDYATRSLDVVVPMMVSIGPPFLRNFDQEDWITAISTAVTYREQRVLPPQPYINRLRKIAKSSFAELFSTVLLILSLAAARWLQEHLLPGAKFFGKIPMSYEFDIGDAVIIARFIWNTIRKG